MATELQADINHISRLFHKFSTESKAVAIASVSLIATALALLMAFMALNDAKHARLSVEYQNRVIDEVQADNRVLRIRAAKMDAWLKAKGVPTEEIYNE